MKRSYTKGYRVERLAIRYMRKKYGAVCVRSAGSHGACDLLCGNGSQLYAVQVKSGRRLSKVSWNELEDFAGKFKAFPLVLYKPDYKPFIELQSEQTLAETLAKYGVKRRFKNLGGAVLGGNV